MLSLSCLFYFQDENLSLAVGDASVTLSIKFDKETPMRLKKNASVGELRDQFCGKMDLNSSSMRLFFGGERLDDATLLEFFMDGDVIEVFKGCSGGGPPPRKFEQFSEKQIYNLQIFSK